MNAGKEFERPLKDRLEGNDMEKSMSNICSAWRVFTIFAPSISHDIPLQQQASPNPASRARTQYFLNDDSSNKNSCETIDDEACHSKVPDWKCGEGGGGKGL